MDIVFVQGLLRGLQQMVSACEKWLKAKKAASV